MPSFNATDFDNAAAESGVVHQNTTDTDHIDASTIKQGYDYANFSEISPTPVACYPLQEDGGSTINDAAGQLDAVNNGAVKNSEGLLGTTSHEFDGSDDMDAGDQSAFESSTFTATSWFKTTDSPCLLSGKRGGGGGKTADGWTLAIGGKGDAGAIELGIRDGSTNEHSSIETDNTYNDGGWHFAAGIVSDVTDPTTWDIVVDGSSVPTSVTRNQGGKDTVSSFPYKIGALANERIWFMNGLIADTRYYNTDLSVSQASSLYNVVGTQGNLTTQFKSV